MNAQELEARLDNPDIKCGESEIGGIYRLRCRYPFVCCMDPPPEDCYGRVQVNPSTPSGDSSDSDTPREIPPPSVGSAVNKDAEHQSML